MKFFAVQATFIPIGMNELTKRVLFNIQISVYVKKQNLLLLLFHVIGLEMVPFFM